MRNPLNHVEIYYGTYIQPWKQLGDIPVFTRLNWGNERMNITPPPPNHPSLPPVVGQAYGRRPPHRHPAVVHTLHLYPGRAGSGPAQPLCWSEAKNIPAPQTQLCAFTDSHCVARSNTCTYFSMVSLASTTRSLSVHMSCVLLKSESGNQRAQDRALHVNTKLLIAPNRLPEHYFKMTRMNSQKCHVNHSVSYSLSSFYVSSRSRDPGFIKTWNFINRFECYRT